MSSTTTTKTTTTSVSGSVAAEAARLRNWDHLSDYELHHSNSPRSELSSRSRAKNTTNGSSRQLSEPSSLRRALQNPPDWPSNHRRIPQHRPINTELDQSQRRVYTSVGERIFLTIMFSGVRVNVAINRAWNATTGKMNRSWFTYKIGGEW